MPSLDIKNQSTLALYTDSIGNTYIRAGSLVFDVSPYEETIEERKDRFMQDAARAIAGEDWISIEKNRVSDFADWRTYLDGDHGFHLLASFDADQFEEASRGFLASIFEDEFGERPYVEVREYEEERFFVVPVRSEEERRAYGISGTWGAWYIVDAKTGEPDTHDTFESVYEAIALAAKLTREADEEERGEERYRELVEACGYSLRSLSLRFGKSEGYVASVLDRDRLTEMHWMALDTLCKEEGVR